MVQMWKPALVNQTVLLPVPAKGFLNDLGQILRQNTEFSLPKWEKYDLTSAEMRFKKGKWGKFTECAEIPRWQGWKSIISCHHLLIYSAQRNRRTFAKGSQFIIAVGYTQVNRHLSFMWLSSYEFWVFSSMKLRVLQIYAFLSSSSQAQVREKGFAFLPFPEESWGWARKGILVTVGTWKGTALIHIPPSWQR